jgi:hypothetical protein
MGPGGVVEDALIADWQPWLQKGNIWLNPPYSRGLQRKFVEKTIAEVGQHKRAKHYEGYQLYLELGKEAYSRQPGPMPHWQTNSVVCLLPADTSTKLFHELIIDREPEFLKGRIRFKGAPAAAKFGSMIVVFS